MIMIMIFSGALSPPLPETTITIVYTPPTDPPITHKAQTTSSGSYTDTFTATATGVWHAQAHWAGNASYLPSDSAVCAFSVKRRQA